MTQRAAVLGSPIAHSLSPLIHHAGYLAAGLHDWLYTAHECRQEQLEPFLRALRPHWAGLSLTMPLKETALELADVVSDTAAMLGAANTLVLRGGKRYADNTDARGMADALREVGVTRATAMAVLGAGGTARAALGAADSLGARRVEIYARRRAAVMELEPVARGLGIELVAHDWSRARHAADHAELVVSTMPKGVTDDVVINWHRDTVFFDVLYAPWPTALAARANQAGCRVVGGLSLLLWQAVHQFELFTARRAPVAAMREALYAAVPGSK